MAIGMQAMTKGGGYRPDIQIFRGIAVLAVLLFHLGLPGFNSGFLGVDIFFVISGYLMQHLYGRGITARDFYNRRARRILPAYYGVLIATLAVGFFMLLPSEFGETVDQGIFAAILLSNIGHWTLNPYFSNLDFSPFLHFWSLGVEVQFYVLFPLVLALTRRFPWLLVVGLAASLLLCVAVDFVSPKTSFFWLPTRFWEFAIGMCAARWPAALPRPWIGLSAAALLVLSLFIPIDISAVNPISGHPGLIALVTTCLTGIALRSGLPNSVTNSLVGQLGQRLGDVSYSLYLAHFPVIVLAHYRPFSGTLAKTSGPADLIATVIVIAAVTAVTYLGLERNSPRLWKPLAWAAVAGAVIAACLILPGLQLRMLDPIDRNITSAKSDRGVYRCGKLFRITHPFDQFCPLNAGGTPVMLIGDSHADALKSAFVKAAASQGYSVCCRSAAICSRPGNGLRSG
jgi:peptidoglycan/LPS O-acetylase OafA/YrhL